MPRNFVFVVIFALVSCSNIDRELVISGEVTPKEMRNKMLGQWCGQKQHDDGTYQEWWINRFPDGTYRVDFKMKTRGKKTESWGEYGVWGIRNPIYFTVMRGFIEDGQSSPADPTEAAYYDAYKIVSLTESEFTYNSFTSGNTFTVKRKCSKKINTTKKSK